MPIDEPQLPIPAESALVIARDQIVEVVDYWGRLHWRSEAIGHAGKVTQEFIRKQAGKGIRSVITALRVRTAKLSGGSSVQAKVTWAWFLIVPGTLEDRTSAGLTIVGEGLRLIVRDVWGREIDDSAFCRVPDPGVEARSLYEDKDEKTGLSVWMLSWDQDIDLGAAGRAKIPGPDVLQSILGEATIDGDPNTDTLEILVQ